MKTLHYTISREITPFNKFLITRIDILAINESKIDDSIPDNEIGIPGYNLIRKDRDRAGAAEISRPHNKNFLVCTWSRPPNSDMDLRND